MFSTCVRLAFRGNAKYVPDFTYHSVGKWHCEKYCCMLKYAVLLVTEDKLVSQSWYYS